MSYDNYTYEIASHYQAIIYKNGVYWCEVVSDEDIEATAQMICEGLNSL